MPWHAVADMCLALTIVYPIITAGNDARFTMEAFLALCGHPACADPLQAHIDSLTTDVRYQQELEESLKAAAAQGWGTPVSSVSQDRATTPVSQDGSIVSGSRGSAAAAANSRPGSGAASAWKTGYNSSLGPSRFDSAAVSSDNGSVASSGGLSPPPGFAARHQAPPPGFEVLSFGAKAGGNVKPDDDDDDYPPGFTPTKNTGPASAASSWAAKLGGGGGVGNAWGRGPPAAAAAEPQRGHNPSNGNAWSKVPCSTAAAASAAGAGPWSSAAAKATSSAWGGEASRHDAAAATGGSNGRGWGQASSRQGGFAAHNSSVDTGYLPVEYEPNPDAF